VNNSPFHFPCGRTRREFLTQAGCGFVGTALSAMLAQDGFFDGSLGGTVHAAGPDAPASPLFQPKA
jgi:hypothetical protein